ncbi:helix-hairpin-helix domain-containing protein [Arcticibacter eurypsychrophilus]|uniref:helix-hairpin-helix domain-containing protein n=1 Tax=Arcticibacter eurypsychrophilus TaxID=1434752 RepID=UPI00084D64A8|nr:helix-hairpin-helix domain-containing protein [Arcticibacter eurypsychrophilus]
MKKWLNAFFGFTKKEQNGLLVLCILICLVALFPWVYAAVQSPVVYHFSDYSKFAETVSESSTGNPNSSYPNSPGYNHSSYSNSHSYTHSGVTGPSGSRIKAQYFLFNPNQLATADWKKLGLSEKQVQVIHHYEDKGGSFRKKEDLKKIYSLSAYEYDHLEPYIRIPETSFPNASFKKNDYTGSKTNPDYHFVKKSYPQYVKRELRVIELNAADSAQLVDIIGIGPVLALRIAKYRNRLGGFHSKEQLREIFGIDSLKYAEIKNQVRVDQVSLHQININTATFEDLKKIPYFSYKQINALIQYKKQHGEYHSIDDLRQISILNSEILLKIAPYLIFQ